MSWKNYLPEAAVGGGAGLAVVVFYIIANGWAGGANAGDWLAFAGALVGTAGAAGTALYVEERRRRLRRRDDLRLLREALDDVQRTTLALGQAPGPFVGADAEKTFILEALDELALGCELFREARAAAKIDDAALWRAIRRVEMAIDAHRASLEREAAVVGGFAPSDEILRISREKRAAFARYLLPLLEKAQDRIARI